MTRIAKILRPIADIIFYTFLAGYWYLVHALYPEYAVIGALLSYLTFLGLRSRVAIAIPQPALLLLTGVTFFLMLNPLQNLIGLPLLIWVAVNAIVFRLCFSQLQNVKWKSGALLASYILFLALPLGMPRLGPTLPTIEDSEHLDVVVVGAGFGGIAMGKELLDAGVTNFRIYEGAPEVGGTWWHNRYPGLHVDVQSVLYSFSYFPNPNWSKLWAPRKELLAYAIELADAVGVRPFIQFNTWVHGVHFNDESQLWEISLGDQRIESRHVVLSNGGLHIPKTPDFEGMEDFEGTRFHSARWREDLDLNNKRIAVVGSGASAVQIIPQIAKVAGQVDMYQRTPNWVAPQGNKEVSGQRQWAYEYVPLIFKLERLRNAGMSELGYRAVFPLESSIRDGVEERLKGYIRATVEDKQLAEKLIPDYQFGCKRPLVTDHYYPSLNRDNVAVITEGIERFTSEGILSREDIARNYDIIIMATGYDLAAVPFPVEGRDGLSLGTLWQEKPEAYEGMMVHGFPNLHLMAGPNSGFIGSFIIHLESAAGYNMEVIRRADNAQLIEPRLDAQQSYNKALQEDLQQTVWAGSCKSWYKLDNGHVIANHPHAISRVLYDRSRPRWDDFIVSERVEQTGH
jgi:cation diffusion facilitator CzcD-associated flavoprotein CzcO